MKNITREELMQPFTCTCGTCGGEAYIIPALGKHGTCVCSRCTFGVDKLSPKEMELRIMENFREQARMQPREVLQVGLTRWLNAD